MKITVAIPCIGQQELLHKTIALLRKGQMLNTVEYVVIDNASKEPIQTYGDETIYRNAENLGMVRSLQQAVENSDAEILVYLHSDMFIHETGWDVQLINAFSEDLKLAVLGVVGAPQADTNGGRSGTVCAFRDGHLHGTKPTKYITPAVLLDGCFGAYRRAVLEGLDWDAFEENGYFFYDKELSLTLAMLSWHVGVIDFDCEHLGGQTSCKQEFNDTLAEKATNMDAMYAFSERRYLEKWKHVLPVKIRSDWHVDVGLR